jgi:hypothetical protein
MKMAMELTMIKVRSCFAIGLLLAITSCSAPDLRVSVLQSGNKIRIHAERIGLMASIRGRSTCLRLISVTDTVSGERMWVTATHAKSSCASGIEWDYGAKFRNFEIYQTPLPLVPGRRYYIHVASFGARGYAFFEFR